MHALEECHTCMLIKHLVALQGLPSGQVTMDLGNIELTISLSEAGLQVFSSGYFVPTACCL